MRLISFKTVLVCFASLLLMSSCSKKGDPGKDGAPGTNGAAGNQVNASGSFKLTTADYSNGYWTVPTEGGGVLGTGAKVASVTVDSITQEIFSSGTVLLYMENSADFTTPNQWTLLPFSIGAFEGGYSINIASGIQKGVIKVYYYYTLTDKSATVPNIFSATVPDLNFRYLIIPSSKGFGTTSSPVDIHNYDETSAYLHLN